jgi:hypothetical protein
MHFSVEDAFNFFDGGNAITASKTKTTCITILNPVFIFLVVYAENAE